MTIKWRDAALTLCGFAAMLALYIWAPLAPELRKFQEVGLGVGVVGLCLLYLRLWAGHDLGE